MALKDKAREAAIAALRDAGKDKTKLLKAIEAHRAGDKIQIESDPLVTRLQELGFEVEFAPSGVEGVFRATTKRWDEEAMMKGLQHAALGLFVKLTPEDDIAPLDSVIAAMVAPATQAALEEEFGLMAVYGYQRESDLADLVSAGALDDLDAAFSIAAADAGRGFLPTINSTGETLAGRSAVVTGAELEGVRDKLVEYANTLAPPSAIELEDAGDHLQLIILSIAAGAVQHISDRVRDIVAEHDDVDVGFVDIVHESIPSRILARRFKTYANTLGYEMDTIVKHNPGSPTSWGHVSALMPALRLEVPIGSGGLSRGDAGYGAATHSAHALQKSQEYAEALAMTIVDILRDMEFRSVADDQLVRSLRERGVNRPHRRWLGVRPVDERVFEMKKKGPKRTNIQWVRGPGMPDN